MKYLIFLSIVLCLFLFSCSNDSDTENMEDLPISKFSRSDFQIVDSLFYDTMQLPKFLYYPMDFRIIRDSLLFTLNRGSEDNEFTFVQIYNLNNLDLIGELFPLGRGPNELLSCRFNQVNNEELLFMDIVSSKVLIFNIDNYFNNQKYLKEINVPKYSYYYARLNSDYLVGADSRYGVDQYMNEGVNNRLIKIPINEKRTYEKRFKLDYLVGNISQVEIVTNNSSDSIFVFHTLDDLIEVYDRNLKLMSKIKGPDLFDIKYSVGPNNYVRLDNHYYSYFGSTSVNGSIYVVYFGLEKKNEDYKTPVEVLKFNSDGTPVGLFKLDHYIFSLSVNNDESYIYGVPFFEDSKHLIKFKLNK